MHAAATTALLLCAACHGDEQRSIAAPEPARPNLVLVDIDSLRADRLDAQRDGQPVMPNLQALARRGVRFDQMFSQSGWTIPAVQALLTGQYPTMPDSGPRAEAPRMLQDLLGLYGYHTGALWSDGPARRGPMGDLAFGWSRELPMKLIGVHTLDAQVDAFLAEAAQEPFFLLVHHFDAHVPGPDMARTNAHRFEQAPGGLTCPMGGYEETFLGLREAAGEPAARAHVEAHYDGALAGYDEVLGHLFTALSDAGLDDRTWVMLTSNHGEDLFAHQSTVSHGALYDDLLRVPLVVAGPGVVAPGRTVDAVVQTVDLLPTLLDLARVPANREADGISLRPWLESTAPEGFPVDRAVFSVTNGNNLSVRTGRYKLLQRTPAGGWQAGQADRGGPRQHQKSRKAPETRYELYDLVADPVEQHDIWAEGAPPELVAALDAWRAHVRDSGTGEPMSDEAREALQKQGYWGIVSEPPAEAPEAR